MTHVFDGSFDLLPLRASLDGLIVAEHPAGGDFERMITRLRAAEDSSDGFLTWEVASCRYAVELTRARNACRGRIDPLDAGVMAATAKELYRWAREQL